MVVLRLKGFQEKDFAALHPGGTLGTQLSVRVADVMISDEYPLLGERATMKESIAPLAGMRVSWRARRPLGGNGEPA